MAAPAAALPRLTYLQPRVQVPVQPLHDEQHGDAGAAAIAVVDDRPVEIHQSLMLWQRPGRTERLGYRAQPATTWETVLSPGPQVMAWYRQRAKRMNPDQGRRTMESKD